MLASSQVALACRHFGWLDFGCFLLIAGRLIATPRRTLVQQLAGPLQESLLARTAFKLTEIALVLRVGEVLDANVSQVIPDQEIP